MNSVNIAALVLRLVIGGTMIAHGWNHAFGGGKLPGTARWATGRPRREPAPPGVGVVLEAEHTCMTQRGIRALGATTVTSALLGTLRTDPRSRAELFALARVPTSG
jgi:uncharacterized membrane protein YphA (DoxX/SURF4 family)